MASDLFAKDKAAREKNRVAFHRAEADLRNLHRDPATKPEQFETAKRAVTEARLRYWGWTGPVTRG